MRWLNQSRITSSKQLKATLESIHQRDEGMLIEDQLEASLDLLIPLSELEA